MLTPISSDSATLEITYAAGIGLIGCCASVDGIGPRRNSRTCTGTTTVSFADPSADFIRYTNDGSTTPTFTTGTLYTTGVSTASTTTYKAIGCKVQNRKCGAVLTSVYTISN